MGLMVTFEKWNAENAAFWKDETAKLNRRMDDAALRETALRALKREIDGGLGHGQRRSLESILQEHDEIRDRFRRCDGASGGRPRGGGPLQRWIADRLRRKPDITVNELRAAIEAGATPGGMIYECDPDGFSYEDGRGRLRDITWSTLPDLLSRARRNNKNRLS